MVLQTWHLRITFVASVLVFLWSIIWCVAELRESYGSFEFITSIRINLCFHAVLVCSDGLFATYLRFIFMYMFLLAWVNVYT